MSYGNTYGTIVKSFVRPPFTLSVDHIVEDRLRLQQPKTGEPVSMLLPNDVLKVLNGLPRTSPKYYFWTGTSRITSTTGFWRAKIADVFKKAKIVGGHPHRFRDSFAVSLLEQGVSIENVSRLLGHSSITVTQKHYAPWVKTRQDALNKDILRVHALRPKRGGRK